MNFLHFFFFMFFVAILTYLALKNGDASVHILTAGFSGTSNLGKTLQGR